MSRYIDADALNKLMYHSAFEEDSDEQIWDSGCWIRYKMFERSLEATPTADVAPVRHGRWKRVGDTAWECSACGCISCCNGTYCPDCGAKMDGGEECRTK